MSGSGFGDFVFPPGSAGQGSARQTQVPGDTPVADPTKTVYGEVTDVQDNTLTTILSFVIPVSPIHHLLHIDFGGQNMAEYYLVVDGQRKAREITYFGGKITGEWNFRNPGGGGLLLPAGKVLKVQVEHNRLSCPADFFTTVYYMEIK